MKVDEVRVEIRKVAASKYVYEIGANCGLTSNNVSLLGGHAPALAAGF